MFKQYSTIIVSCLLILILSFLPYSLEIILAINFIVLLGIAISRLVLASKTPLVFGKPILAKQPMVSIHIPICNEPSNIVCDTIQAAVQQNYDNYEIIVLCNNTKDESLWKPVQNYCKQYEGRVRFINVPKLSGYKAGALNMCRRLTHQDAKYIFTLDADYLLRPKAIHKAVQRIESHGVALVQFPQAYFNIAKENSGLEQEYNHFFNCYAAGASDHLATLPTGTLTILRISALDSVGGWSSDSITEDTQLGMLLMQKGYNMLYCRDIIGTGMTPLTTKDYKLQRSRWIFGNMQTLLLVAKNSLLSAKDKWYSGIQLTAWFNFTGIPLVAIFMATVLKVVNPAMEMKNTLILSVISLLFHTIFQGMLFLKSTKFNWTKSVLGLLANFATLELSAFYWWTILVQSDRPFITTKKEAKRGVFNLTEIILPVILLACGSFWYIYSELSFGLIVMFYGALQMISKLLLTQEMGELTTTPLTSYTKSTLS